MTTDDTTQEEAAATEETTATEESSRSSSSKSNRILLVPYPKFIFMYPTLIMAAICSVVLYFGDYHAIDPATDNLPVVMTGLFMTVLIANMFILVFDFPRATSLTLVFIATTALLGLWVLSNLGMNVLPTLEGFLSNLRPAANDTFFVCIFLAMTLMYIAIFISVRFNYWELRHNELLHHHGILSDLKRYPAPNLRVDKEINDVFEYMLLGAGRLILHPTTEKRAIVLDNILFVSEKEKKLTKTLGSIKVQLGTDSNA